MTVTEQPAADTAPKETNPPAAPAPGGPSVRTVATVAGVIAATAAAVITFVAGGWIALAAAGGVAAVGGVATVRAKNPRPRKTKPGLLTTLIGRPRKPGKTSTGSLPWSLTGSQSRRAAKGAGMRTGMKSGRSTGRARGTGPKLPAVTAKGRARKAATAAGRPLATTRPARPVAKTAKTAKAATVKKTAGPGKGRASTPTKTPAKPTAKKLVTGTTPKPKPKGAPSTPKASGTRPRLAAAKKPGTRPNTGRVPTGGKGATILPFKRPTKKALGRPTSRPTATSTRRPGTGVTSSGKKFPRMSQRRRPTTGLRGTTGGKRLGKTTGGPATKRARRLATPKAGRILRGRAATVPNRTPRRPTTGTGPASKRRLIGTAMRVPRRNKLSFRRPTKAQARKAKRTLWLRSRLAGRRMLGRVRRSPGWLFGHRPGWLWPAFLPPIQPEWSVPNTEEPKLAVPVPDRERGPRRARTPYPQLTGRRAVPTQKEHTVSSTPLESISEALNQLTSFDPENALEIEQFIAGLGGVFTEFSSNLAGISDRWTSEQPLASEVLDSIHQVASVCAGAADMAGETHTTFEAAHEMELTRLREPRANEQAWDVTQNQ